MMIKNLLENDFISHYRLSARVTVNIVSTTDADFDLIDDLTLKYPSGDGIAKYSNPNRKEVNIINYESFINSMPLAFRTGRENCDLIVYTSDFSCFLLNELTDTEPQYIPDFALLSGTPRIGKRNKAISQLIKTLNDISDVATIKSFIDKYLTKHCCFFNKKAHAPYGITATIAFSRLSTLSSNGFQMSNPVIEAFGFELWEFSGTQTYLLQRDLKSFAKQISQLPASDVNKLLGVIKSL